LNGLDLSEIFCVGLHILDIYFLFIKNDSI